MLCRIVSSAIMITAATHSARFKKHDVADMGLAIRTRIIPWFAYLRAAAGVGSRC